MRPEPASSGADRANFPQRRLPVLMDHGNLTTPLFETTKMVSLGRQRRTKYAIPFGPPSRREAYFFFIAAVTYGFLAACPIHESTWISSSSSMAVNSTPRVAWPMPVGVTGGSGCSSLPQMNISFR